MAKKKSSFMPCCLYLATTLLVTFVTGCMVYVFSVISNTTQVYMPLMRQVEAISMDVMTLQLWFDETAENRQKHSVQSIRTRLKELEQKAEWLLAKERRLQDKLGNDPMRPASYMAARLQTLHRIVFKKGFPVSGAVSRNGRLLNATFQGLIADTVSEDALLKQSISTYLSGVYRIQTILISGSIILGAVVFIMYMRLSHRRKEEYQAVVRAEQRLRESQARLAEAEEIARMGNWSWDIQHDRITCSDETYRLFGVEAAELGTYAAFQKRVHPDDQHRVRQAVEASVREHVPYRCDYRVMRPDGEECIIYAMGLAHLDGQGRAVSMFGTVQDVTEQRHADEQMRRLSTAVEQADECVVIADQNGIIEYVNPAFERLSGYAASEVIGKRPSVVKSGEHPEAYYHAMWDTLAAGKRWAGSFVNRHKDGSLYEVEQSISPILDDEGRITGFSSVQRDVTEQKKQRSQLEHTQRLEALGVLAGGVAHDFNNILTAIMGNASLAEHKIDRSSAAVEHLARIESAAQRAGDLCRQMLAYSGKGHFAPVPLNLSALVGEMTKLLEVSIAKNVTLRLELDEGIPAIEADAAQMQQVVMNLVINAAESIGSENGMATVRTGIREVDREYLAGSYLDDQLPAGSYVYMEVEDTGCGMDEETCAKVFDPFFTTKFTGRGLGMSAVLGIVRRHRGSIRIHSDPGTGSAFKVLLPCVEVDAVGEVEEAVDIAGWRGSGVVLVVDDEETIRETARMTLEACGFKVLQAENGEDGVAAFHEHADEIVAVLLDMTMPRMNGDVAFEKMCEIRADVPVVTSSGYSENEISSRFSGRRLPGFIQKPYSPADLKRKFREVLDA